MKRTAVVAGLVVLVLAAGLSVSTIGWRQARVERDKALQARAGEEAQRRAAQSAQKVAETERERATESQEQSRRLLYASDMYLAQQELKDNNLGHARRLLDRHRPQPGEEDLRGWEWRYLWQLTRSTALVTLTNGPVGGSSVSFSPNGTRLAVGWSNGRIDLWDVPGRQWIRTLTEGKDVPAGHVAFSPVRNLLAATSNTNAAENDSVSLYDFESGHASILWRLPGPDVLEVRDLEFSPDGSRVVIYSGSDHPDRDDEVWVVNVSSAKIENHYTTGYNVSTRFGGAQLSSDNQRLYLDRSEAWNYGYRIQSLDLATGHEIWRSERVQDSGLSALAISPDGRLLASGAGYEDPSIRVWDAATGRLVARLEGHSQLVSKLAFSRDGRRLISASADQSIRIWDTNTWNKANVLRGHRAEVQAVAISETGHLLASASNDGDLMLWTDEENKANDGYVRMPQHDQGMPLDRSRMLLVQSKNAKLFDVRGSVSLGPVPGLGNSTNIDVCGFASNWLCRWDGTNQILVEEWSGSRFVRHGAVTLDLGTRPTAAIFNPARHSVAWCEPAKSNSVYVADLDTPARKIELKSEITEMLQYLFFGEDGKYLAAIPGQSYALRVWNTETGQTVVTSSDMLLTSLAFAARGRVLVASFFVPADDHEIRFYDLDHPNRAPRRVRGRHESSSLAVSPDSKVVAASFQDAVVRQADAATGELIEDMRGNGFGLAFSKDGRRLISAGAGHDAVKLLDVGTRQGLLDLSGIGPPLYEAFWSADEDTIFTGTLDQVWQAWHAPSWQEIAAAEAKEKAETQQP